MIGATLTVLAMTLVGPAIAAANSPAESMAPSLTHAMARLVLQLAVILLAAKLTAEVCERYLRLPGVIGELVIGMVLGPFALGGHIPMPGGHEPLFAAVGDGPVPVSTELYAVAQLAAVLLLFTAGLETNLRRFFRYAGPATIIAIGGVVLPFAFGVAAARLAGATSSWMDPEGLFIGAIMTATSVGITARVLSDIGRLESTEGVTILAGAVVDDVLGIILLAIVVNIATSTTGAVDAAAIGVIAARAIVFWLALTSAAILLGRHISRVLTWFRSPGATTGLAVALCFLAASLAELKGGLAMIIGAYSVGLGLSSTRVKDYLEERLQPAYQLLVPVFFVVMGMMVDLTAIRGAWLFGGVLSLLAIASKVIGCGVPALLVGFNRRGAARIGVGMTPRGEVALIVAGVGLAAGFVGPTIFGVAIMMTMVTTLAAPIALVPLFRNGGSGHRSEPSPDGEET